MTSDIQISLINCIKILYSSQVSSEEKTDSLLVLFSYYQKHKDDTVVVVIKESDQLMKQIQTFLTIHDKALSEAALSVLGQYLSNEKIVCLLKKETMQSIIESLTNLLEGEQEKSVCIRCFWCFSHQVITADILKDYIVRILLIFAKLVQDKMQSSETVLNQGLKAIKRLCEQCPKEMEEHLEMWVTDIIQLAASNAPKIRKVSIDIIEIKMDSLLRRQKYLKPYLLDELNNKDLSKKLKIFFHEDVCPVHVLNLWSCLLRFLGEGFFEMNRTSVTNPLLKIAEKAFASKSSEILLALNNFWRSLIDVVFLRSDEFERKMEKIFLLPLQIRYRNEVIANESLKTNWHLICKLNHKINEFVEKVVLPLLDKHLTSTDVLSCGDVTGKLDFITPEQPTKRKSLSRPLRARHVPYLSTKLIAMEMLTQLLTEETERNNRGYKLELFPGPVLSAANIVKYHEKWNEYLWNASESCTLSDEVKLNALWCSVMVALRSIPLHDKKMIWEKVLLLIKALAHQSIISVLSILRLLLLIPDEVLHWSYSSLKNKVNTNGHVWLHTMELLLHKNILGSNGHEHERLFILYERMIGVIFNGITGKLHYTGVAFTLLETTNSLIQIQDVRWRFWSTLTYLLNDYVAKTNDISEEDSCLEHNFGTVLKSLTYPITSLDIAKLQEGTLKELMTVWREMYKTFSRAVNLLTGAEVNVAAEKLCTKIIEILRSPDNVKTAYCAKSYSLLLKMIDAVVHSLDFAVTNQIYSGPVTPTKVSKKLVNPLGNFKAFLELVEHCFSKLTEMLFKDSKATEQPMFDLTSLLDFYYTGVVSRTILCESTRILAKPMATLMENREKCTGKLVTRIEKLIYAIFNSFEHNNTVVFDEDVLSCMEDLILHSIKSERKPLIKRTITFWNSTFGKSENLQCSNELKNAFRNCKSRVIILLPGFNTPQTNRNSIFIDSQDDLAQLPDYCQKSPKLKTKGITSASPIRIHGSFLHGGMKGEAKLQRSLSCSPGDVSPKSPRNLTPNKNVRRKLPISLNEASCDFVVITDSPKKKRLLTEHQKEIMMERKAIPVMCNNLDRSQDTSLFNIFTQDHSTQDIDLKKTVKENKEASFHAIDQSSAVNNGSVEKGLVVEADKNPKTPVQRDGLATFGGKEKTQASVMIDNESTVINETEDMDVTSSESIDEEKPVASPDVVPSSQNQELVESPLCRKSMSFTSQLETAANSKTTLVSTKTDDIPDDNIPDVYKSNEKAKTNSKSGVSLNTVVTKSVDFISPLRFCKAINSDNENDKKEKHERKNRSISPNQSPSLDLQVQAQVVLEKLSATQEKQNKTSDHRNKRKRGVVLKVLNQNKRRKPDTISTKTKKNSKDLTTPKDIFDFSESSPDKVASPISGRTRRNDKRDFKQRHSAGGRIVSKTEKQCDNLKTLVDTDNLIRHDHVTGKQDIIAKTVEKDHNLTSENSAVLKKEKSKDVTKTAGSSLMSIGLTKKEELSDYVSDSITSTGEEIVRKLEVLPFASTTDITTATDGRSISILSPAVAMKNLIDGLSACSPSRKVLQSDFLPPSPVNGILKKGLNGNVDSPSSLHKRVSFQLPGGIVEPRSLVNDDETKKFTIIKNKLKDGSVEDESKIPVYPELIHCNAPIEKILPSITLSRGISHVVRAQNILTVGDLSSLSEKQIGNLPIRSPKVKTVRNALRTFSSHITRDHKSPLPKSPLVIAQPLNTPIMDTTTPTKDEFLAKEAALLATPSRHSASVKPTSLFICGNENQNIPDDLALEESFTVCNKETDDSLIEGLFPSDSDVIQDDGVIGENEIIAGKTDAASQRLLPAKSNVIEIAVSLANPKEAMADVAPTTLENVDSETAKWEPTTVKHEQSCNQTDKEVKTILSQIDLTTLSTTTIFDVVSELDKLRASAMEELRARMMKLSPKH